MTERNKCNEYILHRVLLKYVHSIPFLVPGSWWALPDQVECVRVVTGRVIDRLVLSHERLGDADGHASEDPLLGIDKVPHPSVGQCRLLI